MSFDDERVSAFDVSLAFPSAKVPDSGGRLPSAPTSPFGASLISGLDDRALLNLARATARKLKASDKSSGKTRTELCLSLLDPCVGDAVLSEFRDTILQLPIDDRHYWIGTFYTLMLSLKVRREQATYFTPPSLANAVVDLAIEAGFDPKTHRVLDPAAGGAAFLSTIIAKRLDLGVSPEAAAKGLRGIEIDEGLVEVSRALAADRLGFRPAKGMISVADALSIGPHPSYDLVIANPPYGRVSPADLAGEGWKKVADSGHINKYAVFAELCLRYAKVGGVVALVLPSSFRAGPLYHKFRAHLRSQGEIVAIGSVLGREGVFADVAQDVSVIVVRKGAPHPKAKPVAFPVLGSKTGVPLTGTLPDKLGAAWPIPQGENQTFGGATLADYGVQVRAGYFVWNREGERLVSERRENSFPLIWAKNIKAGSKCVPSGKKGKKTDFVTFSADSSSIIRSPAAVLQRTTNDKQPRRLIAAVVSSSVVKEWGGFVTENHTIVLLARTAAELKLVVSLLNTKAVDDRYRMVSGTAAISVNLLRALDLPKPEVFSDAMKKTGFNAEKAAGLAYLASSKGGADG